MEKAIQIVIGGIDPVIAARAIMLVDEANTHVKGCILPLRGALPWSGLRVNTMPTHPTVDELKVLYGN